MTTNFAPQSFNLDPRAQQYELDQEVAALIATALFDADPHTQQGANDFIPKQFTIDPTGESTTVATAYTYQEDSDDERGYRVSFRTEEAEEDINRLYAKEVRHAFLNGERLGRTGILGTMAMSGFIIALPEAPSAIIAFQGSNGANGAGAESLIMAAGAVVGGMMLQKVGTFQHLYRLNVSKPGTFANRRKLNVAAKMAENLKLPPVVIAK